MGATRAVLVAVWLLAGVGPLASAPGCAGGNGGSPSGTGGGAAGSGAAGTVGAGGTSAGASGTNGAGGGVTGAAGTGAAGQTGAGGTGAGGVSGGGTSGSGSGGAAGRGGAGGGAAGTAGGAAGTGGRGGSAGGGSGGGTGGAATRWTCPAGPFTNPFPLSATPTRVTGVPPVDTFNNNGNNFGIIEGPVWLGDALYVSEIGSGGPPPASRILKIDGTGAVTIAVADAGSNGLAIDHMGGLLSANHKFGAITAFALPSGTPTQVVSMYGGARFDSPNDLAVRSDGTIYFSDPDYQAAGTRPQTKTRLYRAAPNSSTALVVDENRQEPNGVTLSIDETTLYVDGSDGLFSYPVNTDGTVGTGTKLTQSIGASDGMAIDCQGNLYVATNATLAVVSPTGAALGTIMVNGVQSVTNAAFGGTDHRTLYITALGSGSQMGLFKVTMPLPGMPY